jgi:hypothetical protein
MSPRAANERLSGAELMPVILTTEGLPICTNAINVTNPQFWSSDHMPDPRETSLASKNPRAWSIMQLYTNTLAEDAPISLAEQATGPLPSFHLGVADEKFTNLGDLHHNRQVTDPNMLPVPPTRQPLSWL